MRTRKQILIFKSSEICSNNTDMFTMTEGGGGGVGGVSAAPIHAHIPLISGGVSPGLKCMTWERRLKSDLSGERRFTIKARWKEERCSTSCSIMDRHIQW